jgi:DNA-binding CsgD family transcriptional regulator
VTIELHEHPIAHAARVLRESGATAAQTKVGIHLALGKPKPAIADELGIQLSSVADHTKMLYQTLCIHNSAELATKIWLGQKQNRRAKAYRTPDEFFRHRPQEIFRREAPRSPIPERRGGSGPSHCFFSCTAGAEYQVLMIMTDRPSLDR